jgi:plasmid stabilization system protein ParE
VLTIEITPRAALHIERAARWWAQNRLAVPEAIRLDLHEALTLLAQHPGIGGQAKSKRYPDLRRLFLTRVGYHVYYRVKENRLLVMAFWHGSRGSGPVL